MPNIYQERDANSSYMDPNRVQRFIECARARQRRLMAEAELEIELRADKDPCLVPRDLPYATTQ